MLFKKLLLGLLFFSALANNSLVAQSWELEKNEEGIKIYTRTIEGSPLKEYKAVAILNSTADVLIQLLKNQDDLKTWFDLCNESKRLKKVSEDEYYFYFNNDAPWPVKDRDNVTHAIFELREDGTHWITLEAVPNYIPEKSGRVRIPKMKAHWSFKELADGTIEATQQAHVDLGGSIPSWMANATVVDSPFKTMQNLKKKLKTM